VGIDYGVYGVPETFVIDKRGVIRYKQIGILTPEL
jgi:cytochrome c biogenesis protein CcmG/thiol:disulfide interchange protein DsbE